MSNNGEAVAGLTAVVQSIQKNQEDFKEFNMNVHKRTMEKLDLLPAIDKLVAVMTRDVSHLNENFLKHLKDDEKLDTRIGLLEKESWVKRGIAIATSGAVAWLTTFLHRG